MRVCTHIYVCMGVLVHMCVGVFVCQAAVWVPVGAHPAAAALAVMTRLIPMAVMTLTSSRSGQNIWPVERGLQRRKCCLSETTQCAYHISTWAAGFVHVAGVGIETRLV
eukprot:GHVU01009815.1.p2 GENE.GHVU01009815.1~~GHVU01009815.1.p2  ORF type:complete len:109 (-),score=4.21 GHVU01009815.1:1390-1716(-)